MSVRNWSQIMFRTGLQNQFCVLLMHTGEKEERELSSWFRTAQINNVLMTTRGEGSLPGWIFCLVMDSLKKHQNCSSSTKDIVSFTPWRTRPGSFVTTLDSLGHTASIKQRRAAACRGQTSTPTDADADITVVRYQITHSSSGFLHMLSSCTRPVADSEDTWMTASPTENITWLPITRRTVS